MTEEELERVAERLSLSFARALQQARSVSDSEHYDHHIWVSQRIQHEKSMTRFWEDMRDHLAKWGMVGAVSCIGYALWLWLKQEIVK